MSGCLEIMHELCAIIVGEVPDKNHHNVEHSGAEGGENLPHGDAASGQCNARELSVECLCSLPIVMKRRIKCGNI